MANYYEILGCDKSATREELKLCYREKVKKSHPDKTGNRDSGKEFSKIDEAWKILRNPTARMEYDLTVSKNDLENCPLYGEIELEEMTHDSDGGTYRYECRCGGIYVLYEEQAKGWEKLRLPCDECTFHIAIKNTSK